MGTQFSQEKRDRARQCRVGVGDGECRGNVGAGGVESEPPGTGLAQGMSDGRQTCQEVKRLRGGGGCRGQGTGARGAGPRFGGKGSPAASCAQG